MNIDAFLSFLMKHNATIIEVLVGVVLLMVLMLAVRSFLFSKDEGKGASASSMADLEASLKNILEKANQVPRTANGEADAPLLAEIGKLKSELEAKQKQIEELAIAGAGAGAGASAAAGAGGPALSSDEKDKLEAQIKELQAKLSEYEIISEDIADLSFYKEQNARLQKELDAAKGGAPAGAAVDAAPAAPAPAATDPLEESMSALTAQTAAAPAATSAPEPIPGPAAESPAPVTVPSFDLPTTPAAQAPAQTAPVEEVAPPVENVMDNDLMAEFNAAVEKQKDVSGEESADLGSMNMDKMLAEAAEIKTDVPDIKPEDVLNQSLDENKLLQEADAMKKEVGTSEDKKLMGDFENFVKKGEG